MPLLGIWLNYDPIEEKGGLNLYGFCNNNSINKRDYLGYAAINWRECLTCPLPSTSPIDYFPSPEPVEDDTSQPFYCALFYIGDDDFDYTEDEDDSSMNLSFGGTVLFNTFEFVVDYGCVFFCYSLTPTEVLGGGVGVGVSVGDQENPVSIGIGAGKYLSICFEDNGPTFNLGLGIGLPISMSYRMGCSILNEYDFDGCPCMNRKPLTFGDKSE